MSNLLRGVAAIAAASFLLGCNQAKAPQCPAPQVVTVPAPAPIDPAPVTRATDVPQYNTQEVIGCAKAVMNEPANADCTTDAECAAIFEEEIYQCLADM